jgi:hypothetical protein
MLQIWKIMDVWFVCTLSGACFLLSFFRFMLRTPLVAALEEYSLWSFASAMAYINKRHKKLKEARKVAVWVTADVHACISMPQTCMRNASAAALETSSL